MKLRLPSPKALVWVGMVAFAAVFTSLSVLRHRAFNTGRFDLGNIVQAIWTTAHGHGFLQQTNLRGEQISRLGSHFEPILAVFAPLWLIWPSPDMLVTVQALALASGALPVFWLGRKYLRSERAAFGLALVYLIYPPLQWLALDEFHPGALACPLLLYAFWFLDEDRLVLFGVFALIACTTREEMPLIVAGMGLWYALRRRNYTFGLGVAATGLLLTAVIVTFVTPHFRHGAPLSFYGRYKDVGGSPSEAVRMIFSHPIHVLQIAFDHRGIRYLFDLLLPLAGVCLLAPLALIPAVPLLAINLLSSAYRPDLDPLPLHRRRDPHPPGRDGARGRRGSRASGRIWPSGSRGACSPPRSSATTRSARSRCGGTCRAGRRWAPTAPTSPRTTTSPPGPSSSSRRTRS